MRLPSTSVISYIMLAGLPESAYGTPKNKHSVMQPYFIGSKYKFKISKSCLNHRMRKIAELAQSLAD